jgi:hypothetical protein
LKSSTASTGDLDAEVAREHLHDHVALVQAQQAVVDEDAVSWSPIALWISAAATLESDAAGQAEDDFLATECSRWRARFLDVVALTQSEPQRNAMHEALDDRAPLSVCDFRGTAPRKCGSRRPSRRSGRTRRRHGLEAGRQFHHRVAVAHPTP